MGQPQRQLISQSAYANSRKARGLPGGTREAVSKAVEEGAISTHGTRKLVDPDQADREWTENRRARPAKGEKTAAAPETAPSAPPEAAAAVNGTGYAAARARREQAEAEKAEIELRRLTGELVAYEDVLRGGFEAARDVRDTMTAAERDLAAELAAVKSPDACLELLRRHHRAVCESLVRGWREKIGAPPAGSMP